MNSHKIQSWECKKQLCHKNNIKTFGVIKTQTKEKIDEKWSTDINIRMRR